MQADFVIITALEEERDAVLEKLPNHRQLPPDEQDVRVYYHARLPTSARHSSTSYDVILMTLPGMGRVEATNATKDAINKWHPRYVILVGIAGGVAERGVAVGDVLVSDHVVDYELQKLRDDGPEVRWQVHRTDPRLMNQAKALPSSAWLGLITKQRPQADRSPARHVGPIATGDKVVAVSRLLGSYLKYWPNLVGVEMEAGGVASACFQSANPPGFFMVRGVSDLADEDKNQEDVKAWRPYACDVAAAYAIALLRAGPVRPVRSIRTRRMALIAGGVIASLVVGGVYFERTLKSSPTRPTGTEEPDANVSAGFTGVVRDNTGATVVGVEVHAVGFGSDITNNRGEFYIRLPASIVGQRVSLRVNKESWVVIEPKELSFLVPADWTLTPLSIVIKHAPTETQRESSDLILHVSEFNELEYEKEKPENAKLNARQPREHRKFVYRPIYRSELRDGELVISPHLRYLSSLESGGPISEDKGFDPSHLPFPALDVKLVNNTRDSVLFTDALLMVDESRLDPYPVPSIESAGCLRTMALTLTNIGWGPFTTCRLHFNIQRPRDEPDFTQPFRFTADVTDNVNKDDYIDLSPFFSQLSVLAVDPYSTGTAQAVGEIEYSGLDVSGRLVSRRVKFSASVNITAQPCHVGASLPPTRDYTALLEPDKKDYVVRVPISQSLSPGGFDRFTIHIAALKSSAHRLRLVLVYNNQRKLTSQPITLNLFFPTSSARSLEMQMEMEMEMLRSREQGN
jgi:nucleoside phosphorylase